MYRWSSDHTFEKLRVANPLAGRDTLRYRYRNVRLGELHSVDLTNPLRPVLFYRDAQTVVWLHRNLTELRQLNLLDLGLAAIDAVAYAQSEGLWVYAADRQQLLQLDRDGNLRYESPELSQTFGDAIRGERLVATGTQVVLGTDAGRLLMFGPFGGYRTQVLQDADYLAANGDRLVFRSRGEWFRYSGSERRVEPVTLPPGRSLLALNGDYALWRKPDGTWQVETQGTGP